MASLKAKIAVIKSRIKAIDIRGIDRMILMIATLSLLVVITAILIYIDPNGRITGRPAKVDSFNAYDATYESVSLRWDESSKARKYVVYRSENEYIGFEKVKEVTGTEYTDHGLKTGKEYWYRVRAMNDTRRGGKSKRVYIKPKLQKPAMTARSTGDGVLIKIGEVPGADGYELFRDGEIIAKGDGLEYMDESVKESKPNQYIVRAYRRVDDKMVNSLKSTPRVASKAMLNISLNNYEEVPEILAGDDTFVIKGDVKSNATIEKIKVGVKGKNDDKWVSNKTKYEESDINKKDYDIQAANEKIAMDTLPAGEYKLVVVAEMKDGTVKTIKDQDFTVREPKGGELIVKAASEIAWPYGTSLGKYKYHGGSPTQAYRDALSEAYGSRSSWSRQTRAGASCDVFVGTAVRVSGVDDGFPRGLDGVISHCNNNKDKWEEIDDKSEENLKPGDVIYQEWSSGGHVCIYMGDGKVAEAHYVAHGGTYAVIASYKNALVSPSKCQKYHVYRSRL